MDQKKLEEIVMLALGKASTGALSDEQVIVIAEQLVAKVLALIPTPPPPA